MVWRQWGRGERWLKTRLLAALSGPVSPSQCFRFGVLTRRPQLEDTRPGKKRGSSQMLRPSHSHCERKRAYGYVSLRQTDMQRPGRWLIMANIGCTMYVGLCSRPTTAVADRCKALLELGLPTHPTSDEPRSKSLLLLQTRGLCVQKALQPNRRRGSTPGHRPLASLLSKSMHILPSLFRCRPWLGWREMAMGDGRDGPGS